LSLEDKENQLKCLLEKGAGWRAGRIREARMELEKARKKIDLDNHDRLMEAEHKVWDLENELCEFTECL
jgi:hypothetical protein